MQIATCECPGDWAGDYCELDPCEVNPCFVRVNCSLSADGLHFSCGSCPVIDGVPYDGDGVNCVRMLKLIKFDILQKEKFRHFNDLSKFRVRSLKITRPGNLFESHYF